MIVSELVCLLMICLAFNVSLKIIASQLGAIYPVVLLVHHLECPKAACQREITLAGSFYVVTPPRHHDYPLLVVLSVVIGAADLVIVGVGKCRLNDIGVESLLIEGGTSQ
ncbi:hypothetical protein D3C84_694930 [compost metagenome]